MTAPLETDRLLALVQEHRGILYKVANAYCRNRDDRGDLIQEIVLQLWRSFARYDARFRFSTWMYRVAVNVAISAHRSERRHTHETVPLDEIGIELAAADATLDAASDDVRTLRMLVSRLNEIDRAIVLLYLDGYAHDEMASIVGISATNVSTRIGRIKERLQRELEAEKRGAS